MLNAVKLYRIANALFRKSVPLLPHALQFLIRIIYGGDIPYQMVAGGNLHLAHAGLGVVLHPRCVIGNNVTIAQHVTIGGNKGGTGVPKIGDNVYVGPGAKVLGEIVIGDNVIVGANAVVLKSVPDNVVVAGVPAKILRRLAEDDVYVNRNT